MSELAPGARVADRYTLERLLGQGGMGAVWLAHDDKFDTRVALKVAGATGAAHDEFKARFKREARIGHLLGRVPGFVRALDWGQLQDGFRLYLAMDLVPGARPLELDEGPRDARLRRLRRAAELVGLAHAHGVIHRDLKPANLLQAEDGTVWLSDFGLAKVKDVPDEEHAAVTQVTKSGVGLGTPLFMAPEQFDDVRGVDARADVYALGVMLFYALADRFPYEGSDVRTIWRTQDRVREGRAPAPRPRDHDASLPADLDALCASALELERDARLPAVDDFVRALDRALTTHHTLLSTAPATRGERAGADTIPLAVATTAPTPPHTRSRATPTATATATATASAPADAAPRSTPAVEPSVGSAPTGFASSAPEPGATRLAVTRAVVAVPFALLVAVLAGGNGWLCALPALTALAAFASALLERFQRRAWPAGLLAALPFALIALPILKRTDAVRPGQVGAAVVALALPFALAAASRRRGDGLTVQIVFAAVVGVIVTILLGLKGPPVGLSLLFGVLAPLHAQATERWLARRRDPPEEEVGA